MDKEIKGYKIVNNQGGKLVSQNSGGDTSWDRGKEFPELTYAVGEITAAPHKSPGVFVFTDYDDAFLHRDERNKSGNPEIYKVLGFGKPTGNIGSMRMPAGATRVQAVKLVSRVWPDTNTLAMVESRNWEVAL